MKLAVWKEGRVADPRPGMIVGADRLIDLHEFLGPAEHLAENAHRRMDELRGIEAGILEGRSALPVRDLAEVTLLAPTQNPSKIICVGLNYRDHVEEVGVPQPRRPHAFAKLPSAMANPNDSIEVPWHMTTQVDWEAELAVVIGEAGRDIPTADAYRHILGYTIANDISARDWQFADDVQLTLGKGFDTFFPIGPWIVPRDDIDPESLRVRCTVDGEVRQDASTSDMVFGVNELVAFLSRIATLNPGDVIATGTPAGVGWGRTPKIFLSEGQRVEVEIEGIGTLANTVGTRTEPKGESS